MHRIDRHTWVCWSLSRALVGAQDVDVARPHQTLPEVTLLELLVLFAGHNSQPETSTFLTDNIFESQKYYPVRH